MIKLPILSAKALIKFLEKDGFYIVRQRGSHIRLHHKVKDPVTVPNHKTISKGLLKKILRDTQLSISDFNKSV